MAYLLVDVELYIAQVTTKRTGVKAVHTAWTIHGTGFTWITLSRKQIAENLESDKTAVDAEYVTVLLESCAEVCDLQKSLEVRTRRASTEEKKRV